MDSTPGDFFAFNPFIKGVKVHEKELVVGVDYIEFINHAEQARNIRRYIDRFLDTADGLLARLGCKLRISIAGGAKLPIWHLSAKTSDSVDVCVYGTEQVVHTAIHMYNESRHTRLFEPDRSLTLLALFPVTMGIFVRTSFNTAMGRFDAVNAMTNDGGVAYCSLTLAGLGVSEHPAVDQESSELFDAIDYITHANDFFQMLKDRVS